VNADTSVTVRMFGRLHTLRRERGQADTEKVRLPPGGRTAADIATDLGLPLDKIEAVFCNHLARSLDHVVQPGDSIAFVPHGTPGPHRLLLGVCRH
jgi:hypothetical protein